MKKIFALALCLALLVLTLVACGSKIADCEMCGAEDVECTSVEAMGKEGWFCENCVEAAEAAAEVAEELADAFGM